MFSNVLKDLREDHVFQSAALVTATSSGLLLGALAFQYIGGMQPCALCIDQRWWHGIAIAYGLMSLVLGKGSIGKLMGLAAILALLTSAAFAAYHMGVELKWWQGPASCTGGMVMTGHSLEELTATLMEAPTVRCDEVPWSLFGLSMAGWNMVISGLAGIVALIVLFLPQRSNQSEPTVS